MRVILKDTEFGVQELRLLPPEKITVSSGTTKRTYNIIDVGEVINPSGETALTAEWSGTFWGESRASGLAPQAFGATDRASAYRTSPIPTFMLHDWNPPTLLEAIILNWKRNLTRVTFSLVDRLLENQFREQQLPVGFDCFIDDYSSERSGGFGDINYTIKLTEFRQIVINTEQSIATAAPEDEQYTVRSGDTLWGIALKKKGNSTLWPVIFAANTGVIGSNPNLILPGQQLTIPA